MGWERERKSEGLFSVGEGGLLQTIQFRLGDSDETSFPSWRKRRQTDGGWKQREAS